MTHPTGQFLGKWKRKRFQAKSTWQRILIWFVAFIICFIPSIYGLVLASAIPLGQPRTNLFILLVPYVIPFCVGFFILFTLEIIWQIIKLLLFILKITTPEAVMEIYTDGFVKVGKDGRRITAYQWDEIDDCKWQSESMSYIQSLEIDFSDAIDIASAVGHRITAAGYNSKDALSLYPNPLFHFDINSNYDDVGSLVSLLWKVIIENWLQQIEITLSKGNSVYFGLIEISSDWIQEGKVQVLWQDVEFVDIASSNFGFTIEGRTKKGRLVKFEVKPTMKNVILLAFAYQQIPSVNELYERGQFFYRDGDTNLAFATFTQAIRLDPNFAPAYVSRGALHEDLNAALDDYSQAILLNPEYVQAYYNRGFARGAIGDYAGAIADFTRVLELQPDHPQWAHIRLDISEWRKKIKP